MKPERARGGSRGLWKTVERALNVDRAPRQRRAFALSLFLRLRTNERTRSFGRYNDGKRRAHASSRRFLSVYENPSTRSLYIPRTVANANVYLKDDVARRKAPSGILRRFVDLVYQDPSALTHRPTFMVHSCEAAVFNLIQYTESRCPL